LRLSVNLLAIPLLAISVVPTPAGAQNSHASSQRILAAKTVYFDDKIGVPPVRDKALAQLKKWGRFQIVQDRKQADLIFLFSADPAHARYVLLADGRTGSMNSDGTLSEDVPPSYLPESAVRDAFLTVLDARSGNVLWAGHHVWGGLLTGFNSVGARLIKKLQSETKK
jgi:hypothetical protein